MAKKPITRISARQLAIESARLAHDRHCTEIVVLDLRRISPVTDYFVIATGTSDVQMRAVADEMSEEAKGMGHKAFSVSGRDTGKWILLDFIDVVVHLFDHEHRRYYDLELMWGDAPRVAWQGPARHASKGGGETQDEP
ncbi:MAG: ribosome silencing factor [Planctomycetota bacterium]|jgi:ribosome-associated protein